MSDFLKKAEFALGSALILGQLAIACGQTPVAGENSTPQPINEGGRPTITLDEVPVGFRNTTGVELGVTDLVPVFQAADNDTAVAVATSLSDSGVSIVCGEEQSVVSCARLDPESAALTTDPSDSNRLNMSVASEDGHSVILSLGGLEKDQTTGEPADGALPREISLKINNQVMIVKGEVGSGYETPTPRPENSFWDWMNRLDFGVQPVQAEAPTATLVPTAAPTEVLPTQQPTATEAPTAQVNAEAYELWLKPRVESASLLYGGNLGVDNQKAELFKKDFLDALMFRSPVYFQHYWNDYCGRTDWPTAEKILARMQEKNDYTLPYVEKWGDSLKMPVSSSLKSGQETIPKLASITNDVLYDNIEVLAWGYNEWESVQPILQTMRTPLGTLPLGKSNKVDVFYGSRLDFGPKREVPDESQQDGPARFAFAFGFHIVDPFYTGEEGLKRFKNMFVGSPYRYVGSIDTGIVGGESDDVISALMISQAKILRNYVPDSMLCIGTSWDTCSYYSENPDALSDEQKIIVDPSSTD